MDDAATSQASLLEAATDRALTLSAAADPPEQAPPSDSEPGSMMLDETLSVDSLLGEAPPAATPPSGKNGTHAPAAETPSRPSKPSKGGKGAKAGKAEKAKPAKTLRFVKTTRPEKRGDERLGGPARSRIPGAAGLPLLDDQEESAPADAGAMDLPLLDETDDEDELFEWERSEDEPGESKNGTGGLESLDLETLDNWPPTIEDDGGKKKGGKDADPEQMPPWPEEG
jgi:hypothetical protein